jgi:tetratricopeptide (TPR) repeat protein
LIAYYEAEKNLPENNNNYFTTLVTIGQLEFTFNKDFNKSIIAYEKAIQLDNENYEIYYKLMKSCNAAKEFTKADSLFKIVKEAYKNKKLPKADMEFKAVSIAQFEWDGQFATIIKSLEDAKEILDITYKVFLLNKQGDKVERRFVVEKTIQVEKDGVNFLLCEQDKKTGEHITFPYGWKEDNITTDELEKAVKLVLDGKIKQVASSNFNKN